MTDDEKAKAVLDCMARVCDVCGGWDHQGNRGWSKFNYDPHLRGVVRDLRTGDQRCYKHRTKKMVHLLWYDGGDKDNWDLTDPMSTPFRVIVARFYPHD